MVGEKDVFAVEKGGFQLLIYYHRVGEVVKKVLFFFSSRRRHTRYWRDWSSDVCSSDLAYPAVLGHRPPARPAESQAEVRPAADHRDGERERRASAVGRRGDHRAGHRPGRSEERRVGKGCRSRWSPYH